MWLDGEYPDDFDDLRLKWLKWQNGSLFSERRNREKCEQRAPLFFEEE
jgi:hypothetical protein